MEVRPVENQDKVVLFSDQGLSRGSSIWFINLYLKTRDKYTDQKKLLIALAEEFKTGVPRQAALLNSLNKFHFLCGDVRCGRCSGFFMSFLIIFAGLFVIVKRMRRKRLLLKKLLLNLEILKCLDD